MDGDNHEVQELSELRSYVAKGFLSDLQVTIMTEKLRGATYSQLAGYASGPVALSHCLRRTALCLLWVPGMVTGPDPYLSPPDTERFRQLIVQACDDVNCVTVTRALSLALDLRRDRQRRAVKLLQQAGCDRLAAAIEEASPPSRYWLQKICGENEITICRSEELEAARRLYCDTDAITQWFVRFSVLLDRPVSLMFNMDETQVNAKKKLKVLCANGQRPLVTSQPILPHMTAAVTVNGSGHRVKPLLILPNKRTLQSLQSFQESVYFASSTSGWMTRALFRYYALTFVSELSLIRLRLPAAIRDQPALLLLDGHPSRWDFLANLIFYLFNVDVLTFPGHTTHVLQMFDVCIASPLKSEFKQQLMGRDFHDYDASEGFTFSEYRKRTLKELRSDMISSFLTAFEKTTTTANCLSSFAATGVSPLAPERALEGGFVTDRIPQIYNHRVMKQSSRWLNSEETLRIMFHEENGRELTADDLRISLGEIYAQLRAGGMETGIPLSEPPELFIEMNEQKIYKLLSVSEL